MPGHLHITKENVLEGQEKHPHTSRKTPPPPRHLRFSLGITVTYDIKSFRGPFLETLLNSSASCMNLSARSYHVHILR